MAAAADVPARTEERGTGVVTAAVAEVVDENAGTAVVVRGGFTEKNTEKNYAMNNARKIETGVGQPPSTVDTGGPSDNNAAV
jgi:hypothetical protein